jgi:hypothetical protein
MNMKAYKVKFVNGIEYSVRFHGTGGVTIVDKNGEHEIGMWKKPNDESWMYRCQLFNNSICEKDWEQRGLAERLACYWRHRK